MTAHSTYDLLPTSSDGYVAGLTNGTYWDLGPDRTVTWAVADFSGDFYWPDPQYAANVITTVLARYSEVANIRFSYSGHVDDPPNTAANMVFTGTFSPWLFSMSGALAWAYFPNEAMSDQMVTYQLGAESIYPDAAGDIWVNFADDAMYYSSFAPGSNGYFAALHEVGHALGLKHPHDNGGTGAPTFAELGLDVIDSQLFTVMSYDEATSIAAWFASFDLPSDIGYPSTLMPLDVLALQSIYGPNLSTRAGNTEYALANDDQLQTFWDAGGIDVINASGSNFGWRVDLAIGSDAGHVLAVAMPLDWNNESTGKFYFDVENLRGSALGDELYGSADANDIDGGGGDDYMEGRGGDDSYHVDAAGDVVVEIAGQGNDLVISSIAYVLPDGVERLALIGGAHGGVGNLLDNTLEGGSGADVLFGLGGHDWLRAGGGADILDGGADSDRMEGGNGDDTYFVDSADDIVVEDTNQGIDLVIAATDFALGAGIEALQAANDVLSGLRLAGNALANTLRGGAGDDWIIGGDGADVLDGGVGIDVLEGGAGDDTYYLDDPGDCIVERVNGGIDTIVAPFVVALGTLLENERLTGDAPLALFGTAGDNQLRGNEGDNLLWGGNGGADLLAGGLGNDTYLLDDVGDRATEADAGGTDSVLLAFAPSAGTAYALGANFETLTLAAAAGDAWVNGNGANNALRGNAFANRIDGGGGDDVLLGGRGSDDLAGGTGNDVLGGLVHINAGAWTVDATDGSSDNLSGGTGDDTYVVDSAADHVAEDNAAGRDTIVAAISFDLEADGTDTDTLAEGLNVENLVLVGYARNGSGNAVDNLIIGNARANVLRGLAGNDILDGGAGHDTLDGGAGNDVFVFSSSAGAADADSVIAFSTGHDRLRLDAHVFSALEGTATLAPSRFVSFAGSDAALAAHDADDFILYSTTTGALYYDGDGDGAGAPQLFATLLAVEGGVLGAADFEVRAQLAT